MMPALLGGLFIGVLSSLPYIKGGNVCCCLWVISGGALAAWLMQQNTPRPVTAGEGAVVGLLSGLVGTVVWIAWGVIGLAVFSSSPFDMADFQRAMGEAEGMTPEAREALESLSPAVMLVVGGVIWAVVSMAFATLGGLLGAMLFKRKGGPGLPTPLGAGPIHPTFTPPTFTPPAPVVPPPPFAPPPPSSPPPPPGPLGSMAPPLSSSAAPDSDATPQPSSAPPFASMPAPAPPAPAPPAPASWPAPPPGGWPAPSDDPYVGDAPTIMIPARSLNLPPTPKPPAPPSGAVPPPSDREPDSH
jgi:hypothetical protein